VAFRPIDFFRSRGDALVAFVRRRFCFAASSVSSAPIPLSSNRHLSQLAQV
jgi:hypothetical protein